MNNHDLDNLNPSFNQRETILVVEDEVQMQEVMGELLQSNGYTVLLANDGLEAIEMYKQRGEQIALVILDVMLPELDGRDTYYELKKINENIKVFFCSGYTSLVEIQSLLEKENLYAIQKPFSPKEFLAVVKEVLSEEPRVGGY
jgi:two-component system, cell cycle sensor histidine kinase and response regulator CckA